MIRSGRVRPIGFGPPSDKPDREDGRAVVEVIFLGVLLLIPALYILISLLRLQAATFAVTQAARDAGRAIDSAGTMSDGIDRAQQITALDLADQHISADHLTVHFVAAGADCAAAPITPTLAPGSMFDICVTAVIALPGVPTAVTGTHNTVTGSYTVHIGDLREGSGP